MPDSFRACFINLDRHTSRRTYMEDKAATLGLRMTRIRAVDALSDPLPQEYIPRKYTNPRWSLNSLEQAIFASHRKAWKFAADANLPVIVMEDDLLMSDDFVKVVEAIAREKADFDILRLNTSVQSLLFGPPSALGASICVRRLHQTAADAGCYMLPASSAQRLLQGSQQFCNTLDDFIFTPRRNWRVYQLCEPIASQVVHHTNESSDWRKKGIVVSERLDNAQAYTKERAPVSFRIVKEARKLQVKMRLAFLSALSRGEQRIENRLRSDRRD